MGNLTHSTSETSGVFSLCVFVLTIYYFCKQDLNTHTLFKEEKKKSLGQTKYVGSQHPEKMPRKCLWGNKQGR